MTVNVSMSLISRSLHLSFINRIHINIRIPILALAFTSETSVAPVTLTVFSVFINLALDNVTFTEGRLTILTLLSLDL